MDESEPESLASLFLPWSPKKLGVGRVHNSSQVSALRNPLQPAMPLPRGPWCTITGLGWGRSTR